jgi:hypothetical protein
MTPLPASAALTAYYLEARCRLLDIAAILDRIGRGADADTLAEDPRMTRLRDGMKAILELPAGRAEEVQRIFSLPYDSTWPVPQPK